MGNTSNLFAEVEALSDSFQAEACLEYADRFAPVFGGDAERYRRVREPRPFTGPDPDAVYVLSRVTLGADVAVTSVVLDAAKRRFPRARIVFCGSRKGYELFAADARVEHQAVDYPRSGSLDQRLAARPYFDDGIVIDPDSRITQLGLLPVCDDGHYYFFESRSYGGDSAESMTDLARRWMLATFGETGDPFVAIADRAEPGRVAVSLGVGENPAKRVADPFERSLIELLWKRGTDIVVDLGASDEEAARVRRAIDGYDRVTPHHGPFAPFAASIAHAKLYAGYDSAGQHVAAACGTPLIAVFAGFPNERFFHRWRPTGRGPIEVVRVDPPADPARVYADVNLALRRFGIL